MAFTEVKLVAGPGGPPTCSLSLAPHAPWRMTLRLRLTLPLTPPSFRRPPPHPPPSHRHKSSPSPTRLNHERAVRLDGLHDVVVVVAPPSPPPPLPSPSNNTIRLNTTHQTWPSGCRAAGSSPRCSGGRGRPALGQSLGPRPPAAGRWARACGSGRSPPRNRPPVRCTSHSTARQYKCLRFGRRSNELPIGNKTGQPATRYAALAAVCTKQG